MNPQTYDVDLWNSMKAKYAQSRMQMLQSGQLTINGRTMKFVYKTKGARPKNGYTLIFGLHGGGGCTKEVNDNQYKNHKSLYDNQLPDGTLWFTPRSAEEAWDMWFKDYMEDFLLEFIRALAFNDMIDFNKVFITGYSAGGDGVYHLAPRMADHLAGAAMMAGHPNGINQMNIRNIGFSIQVGGDDNAYNRKNQGIKYIRMLNQLGQNYGGFRHMSKIHDGKPHWMNKQQSKVFDWLFSQTRDPYPDTILYKQCPRRKKEQFYYIKIGPSKNGQDKQQLVVFKQGNNFSIYGNRAVTLYLNNKMVNPSQLITVVHNDDLISQKILQFRPEIAQKTLLQRIDPYYIFTDQVVSEPRRIIDMKQTMCHQFKITPQQKDAQYQESLNVDPNKTPANFSVSFQPLKSRMQQFGNRPQHVQQVIPQVFYFANQLSSSPQSFPQSIQQPFPQSIPQTVPQSYLQQAPQTIPQSVSINQPQAPQQSFISQLALNRPVNNNAVPMFQYSSPQTRSQGPIQLGIGNQQSQPSQQPQNYQNNPSSIGINNAPYLSTNTNTSQSTQNTGAWENWSAPSTNVTNQVNPNSGGQTSSFLMTGQYSHPNFSADTYKSQPSWSEQQNYPKNPGYGTGQSQFAGQFVSNHSNNANWQNAW